MRSATVLAKLEGGDRRSVGRSAEVVRDVLRDPTLVGALVQGLRHADPVVRMRAADALEKASRPRPQSLTPFKQELLRLALADWSDGPTRRPAHSAPNAQED